MDKLQFVITLKCEQLKRDELKSLKNEHLEKVLIEWKWKNKKPSNLVQAVNDVLSLSASEVISFLSQQIILDSQHYLIEDFHDLLGGHINEKI